MTTNQSATHAVDVRSHEDKCIALELALRQAHELSTKLVELIDEYEVTPRSWIYRTLRLRAKRLTDHLAFHLTPEKTDDSTNAPANDNAAKNTDRR